MNDKPPRDMSDRELLESLHEQFGLHIHAHNFRDPMIDKLTSTVYGNGQVGLKTKVHLIMAVGAFMAVILGGVVVAVAQKMIQG